MCDFCNTELSETCCIEVLSFSRRWSDIITVMGKDNQYAYSFHFQRCMGERIVTIVQYERSNQVDREFPVKKIIEQAKQVGAPVDIGKKLANQREASVEKANCLCSESQRSVHVNENERKSATNLLANMFIIILNFLLLLKNIFRYCVEK